jgi:hypothetical protein
VTPQPPPRTSRHPAADAAVRLLVRAALGCLCPPLGILSRLEGPRIIIFHAYPDFTRKCEAIADILRSRGLPVEVCSGTSVWRRAVAKSSAHLWIGFWNEYPADSLPKDYILFNAEPLLVDRWRQNTRWTAVIRDALEVWEYNRLNETVLARMGVPFRSVPFGYAPYYAASFRRNTEGKGLVQDIDVLFVGSLTDRRRQILERIRDVGIGVHAVTRANPAYGGALDELLARAKIVLGIHAFSEPQAQIPDLARLDHPLANRLFVLHERPSAVGTYPGFEENVTTCEYDAMPSACAYFLSRPDERERRAEAAGRWFETQCALDAFIPYEALLQRVHRASPE